MEDDAAQNGRSEPQHGAQQAARSDRQFQAEPHHLSLFIGMASVEPNMAYDALAQPQRSGDYKQYLKSVACGVDAKAVCAQSTGNGHYR